MLVVYDVCSGESFANVKRWLHEIDQNCDVVNRILGEFILNLQAVMNSSIAAIAHCLIKDCF